MNLIHQLPSELRLEIFRPLCCEWRGKMPNIIKVLRGDAVLYHEALSIFYENSAFIFRTENVWSFGDMTNEAVRTITRAEIIIEPGIMNEGLWNLIQPLQDASFLTPFITPSLDKAINIRKLTLHFKVEPENEDILPFVAFGRVTFSLNYFIAPFKWLKRVEMVIPKRSCSTDEYCLLLRERKLSYGINLSNSKLRVPARLMMVPALCVEDDDTLNATASTELESLNRWFWEVEGDNYLGQTQGSPILEQVGYSFSYLSLDSSSNWR